MHNLYSENIIHYDKRIIYEGRSLTVPEDGNL